MQNVYIRLKTSGQLHPKNASNTAASFIVFFIVALQPHNYHCLHTYAYECSNGKQRQVKLEESLFHLSCREIDWSRCYMLKRWKATLTSIGVEGNISSWEQGVHAPDRIGDCQYMWCVASKGGRVQWNSGVHAIGMFQFKDPFQIKQSFIGWTRTRGICTKVSVVHISITDEKIKYLYRSHYLCYLKKEIT